MGTGNEFLSAECTDDEIAFFVGIAIDSMRQCTGAIAEAKRADIFGAGANPDLSTWANPIFELLTPKLEMIVIVASWMRFFESPKPHMMARASVHMCVGGDLKCDVVPATEKIQAADGRFWIPGAKYD